MTTNNILQEILAKINKQTNPKKEDGRRNKKLSIIVSIIIAIGLWTYVIGEVNPETEKLIQKIPVTPTHIESLHNRDLAILSSDELEISVIVKGRRGDLNKISAKDISAKIDYSDCEEGENELEINLIVPNGVTSAEARPAFIGMQVDPVVSEDKKVDVTFIGSLGEKYEIGNMVINPKTAKVTGAKTLVDQVTKLQTNVKIPDGKASITGEFPMVAVDAAGRVVYKVKPAYEKAKIEANVLLKKEVTLIVPTKGELKAGYGVSGFFAPKKVMVKGSKDVLSKLDAVSTKPVDLSKLEKDTKVELDFLLPEGVEISDQNEALTNGKVVANIKIVQVVNQSFVFESSEIQLKNLSGEFAGTIEHIPVVVSIVAQEEQLAKEDVQLSIDLSAVKQEQEMSYEIKSETLAQYITMGVEPKSIKVKITKKEN